jgi:hypothetical protein
MMIGTILWNFVGAGIAFVGTFFLSIQSNLLTTSLLRGLYSFIIMFLLVFVVRFVIGLLLLPSQHSKEPTSDEASHHDEQSHLGQRFDMVTPDEDQGTSQALESNFAPLDPPKLETKIEPDPMRAAQAVRHLAGD